MAAPLELVTRTPEETQRIGRTLGEACVGGEAFFLIGPLGAGKTCFTQGLARGLGIDEYTHSPTFVMATEYHGRLTLYHIDLYRVESVAEALDLGLEEYLSSGGVCAIEWADKALSALDQPTLLVEIAHLGERERRIRLTAHARCPERLMNALEHRGVGGGR